MALLITRDGWWRLKTHEAGFRIGRTTCVHADIRARQQRAEPGHATRADTRTHDPEARVLDREVLGFLGQLDLDQHMRKVLGQPDVLHEPNVDVLVFDLGLALFQAFGAGETDGDRRPLLSDRLDHKGNADQRGDQRNHPDERGQPVAARLDLGIGQVRRQLGSVRIVARRRGGRRSLRASHVLSPEIVGSRLACPEFP